MRYYRDHRHFVDLQIIDVVDLANDFIKWLFTLEEPPQIPVSDAQLLGIRELPNAPVPPVGPKGRPFGGGWEKMVRRERERPRRR